MKVKIDAVLVVEGKSDVSYLSSFIDALFFITNGYDLNASKIDFLKRASRNKKIIIFTDPDDAGEEIRKKLKLEINDVFEAKINKNSRKNYIKKGVAESNKQEILSALEPFITNTPVIRRNYQLATLLSLSDDTNKNKQRLIERYRLINGNNKSLENQLNILGIDEEEIRNFICE